MPGVIQLDLFAIHHGIAALEECLRAWELDLGGWALFRLLSKEDVLLVLTGPFNFASSTTNVTKVYRRLFANLPCFDPKFCRKPGTMSYSCRREYLTLDSATCLRVLICHIDLEFISQRNIFDVETIAEAKAARPAALEAARLKAEKEETARILAERANQLQKEREAAQRRDEREARRLEKAEERAEEKRKQQDEAWAKFLRVERRYYNQLDLPTRSLLSWLDTQRVPSSSNDLEDMIVEDTWYFEKEQKARTKAGRTMWKNFKAWLKRNSES